MSYCCELNSLNRNANARREKNESNDIFKRRDAVTHTLPTICYFTFHAMLKRETESNACMYVIGSIQFKSDANANGELHVRNTRAPNNSFHLNYPFNCFLCPATLFHYTFA